MTTSIPAAHASQPSHPGGHAAAHRRRLLPLLAAGLFGLTGLLTAPPSPAQTAQQPYPSRSIRLIVDGPAGGINDIWARRYAQRMSESLAQPIVVENRPGASGSIAAEALAKSAPDGYTMFFGGMNPLVAFPASGGVVRYDPAKDFAGVGVGTMGYPLLVVNSQLGIRTAAELIERAKAKPDDLICGNGGHASVQHFACVLFARTAGIKLRAVPYKGGSAALLDTANGNVQVSVGYSSELEPLTIPGKILAVGAFAPKRLPKFPAAPTWAEAGLPGLELPSFSGFFVPAGTPQAIVERLNAETIKAMAHPQMTEWLQTAGGVYQPFTARQFSDMVRGEQQKWKKMSDETGIKIDPQ